MKKLIFKCSLLLMIVGGLLSLGSTAYQLSNNYRNLERVEETEKFHCIPDEIDIAVFGASHGRDSFKYPPEGQTLFNFSLPSQTPQYDAALLRQFQDQIDSDTLVILTFIYSSPYWLETEDTFQSKQSRYYRILNPENIVDVDLGRYWICRLFPLLALEPGDIASAIKNPSLIPPPDEKRGYMQLSIDDIPDEQVRIKQDFWNNTIAPYYPEVNPVMWDAYLEMLSLSKEMGWKVILVTPPYLNIYNECFPAGFYESFLSRAAELSEIYDIPYLDYSHDPAFGDCLNFYRNIDHINSYGAATFNEKFFADVKAMGLLS